MQAPKLTVQKALNSSYKKLPVARQDMDRFTAALQGLLEHLNDAESEEHNKNLLADFLKASFYFKGYEDSHDFYVNTKGRSDLVIHDGKNAKAPVSVLIEVKAPAGNQSQMCRVDDMNRKALQQLVYYYMQQRFDTQGKDANLAVKHLVVTNAREWFIFDAAWFENNFAANKGFKKQWLDFEEGKLAISGSEAFYDQIAEPRIKEVSEIPFTHFTLEEIQQAQAVEDKKLIPYYKLFSPEHLCKKSFLNDSNSLDEGFYHELLHIMGLEEVQEGGKLFIKRAREAGRHSSSFYEMVARKLRAHNRLKALPNLGDYGKDPDEQVFHITLELIITWINRILFLKLLEGQMRNYHKGEKDRAFMHLGRIKTFSQLDSFFFNVLNVKPENREGIWKERFADVPYLNSSLFEPSKLESHTMFIDSLNGETLPLHAQTVLKDGSTGKRLTGEMPLLEYLFAFLDAYNFSSEGQQEIQESKKNLINASVLGLIFEKINGYKDGSFFTPGFITMYMARETLRRAAVQKFSERLGEDFRDFGDLQNYCRRFYKSEKILEFNAIVNQLRVCDPAVGSGHFLVSCLNELIAIKSELGILADHTGKPLKVRAEIENDEINLLWHTSDEPYDYHPDAREAQIIQKTLFHEKQTLIEKCLFGVDINPNSVKICRLRLWIELLKHAYYRADGQMETLPNLDINIKTGDALVSRFPLDAPIEDLLKRSSWSLNDYKAYIQDYRRATDWNEKQATLAMLAQIKKDFRVEIDRKDPDKLKLSRLGGELQNLLTQTSLLEPTKAELKAREKQKASLEKEIEILSTAIREKEEGRLYDHAFEWRFEFPEVLDEQTGEYLGFDVVIGNPPYIRVDNISEDKRGVLTRYYATLTGKYDLYYAFYERATALGNSTAFTSFVTPNRYCSTIAGQALRTYLLDKYQNITIHSVSHIKVFKKASTYPAMNILAKSFGEAYIALAQSLTEEEIPESNIDFLPKISIKENPYSIIPLNASVKQIELFTKINTQSTTRLEDLLEINEGLRIDQKLESSEGYYELIKQYQFHRYSPIESGARIKQTSVKPTKRVLNGLNEAIVIAEDGLRIEATHKPKANTLMQGGVYYGTLKETDLSVKTILAIMNSRLFSFLYATIYNGMHMGGGYMRYRSMFLNKMPFPETIKDKMSEVLKHLATQILDLKKADLAADTQELEDQIDFLVYKLYELSYEEAQVIDPELPDKLSPEDYEALKV
jgi:hypothetical protein